MISTTDLFPEVRIPASEITDPWQDESIPVLPPPRKTRWSVAELLDTEFPEPKWIVPGIFTEGLVLLGGRPKIGKSWMSLQLAGAVATGGKFLGRSIDQGAVLYYALEDSPRRLKDRIQKLGIPRDAPINIIQETRPLQSGGYDDLARELQDGHYALAVIDTLTRAVPGLDQNEGRFIGPLMARLQMLALEQATCLQIDDHHRKAAGFTPSEIDDPIGATAKVAACDEVAGIFKQQGKLGARFLVTGRDIEPVDLQIHFDGLTGCWQLLGESNEMEISEGTADILTALAEGGKMPLSGVVNFTGQLKGTVYKRLSELVNQGRVGIETIQSKKYYFKMDDDE